MRLAATLVGALALGSGSQAQIMPAPAPPEVTWTQRLGNRVPLTATFRDQDGRTLSLAECLGDRPVVLALVYYQCPMLCGLVLEGMVKSLRAVELESGQDFEVLVVSFDPSEGPELAAGKRASALEAYGLAPDAPAAAAWRFLTGSEADVSALADSIGFGYRYVRESDQWAHPAGISVLTGDGVLSRVLFGVEYAPRDLRLALVEASEGKVGTVVDQVLLRCFHYDPTRGRYGLAILTIVRVLGALTVTTMTFFVVRWTLRERRNRQPALEGS